MSKANVNEKQAGLKLAAQEAVCAAQSGEDGKADPILCSSSVGVDGSTCRTGRQLGVQSDSRCMVILPGGKLEHAKCNIVGDRPKCERAEADLPRKRKRQDMEMLEISFRGGNPTKREDEGEESGRDCGCLNLR